MGATPTPTPAPTPPRTPEQVKQDIEREREQLALAITSLRDDVRAQAPKVAAAAAVALGAIAVLRIVRRRRAGVVVARFGRYTVTER